MVVTLLESGFLPIMLATLLFDFGYEKVGGNSRYGRCR